MKLSTQTHFSQGWNTRLLEDIESLGTDMIRDAVSWNRVETKKGEYDFSHARATWVDDALAAGIDVMLVFNPVNPLYDKGHTVYSKQALDAFADYVVATLKEFPGVTTIEIGNEYNGNSFVTGRIANDSKAARDDYYKQMIAKVDAALDKAKIDVEVIGASTHSIPVDYLDALDENGALDHVDAISIHPYTTPPEQFAQQLEVLRAAIGDDVAIHVTEFGDNFESLAEAPAYLAKMVSVMAAAGVESANWYAFAEQKWFPNMELWDPKADKATPAGVTFGLIEGMLAGGAQVSQIDIGNHAFLYAFGDDAAIMWGAPRSLELADGVTAWDLSGKQIKNLDSLSADTPVILRSASGIDADSVTLGASALIADSYLDFDLTNEAGTLAGFEGPWSYFAESGAGKVVTLETMGGGFGSGEPWTPYLGSNWLRPFQVGAVTVTPADFSAKNNPASEYAVVERFTAAEASVVTIKGNWDVGDKTADGVQLTVELNDEAIFTKRIYDKKNGHEFSLELTGITLAAGDTIDFVIESRNNARGDVTTRHIQILDEDGDASPGAAVAKGPVPDSDPVAEQRVPEQPVPEQSDVNIMDRSSAGNSVKMKGSDSDDWIIGGRGNDKLYGKDGADILIGGKGNDRIYADGDDLLIDGGEGNDKLYVSGNKGLTVDLAAASIEKAFGGKGDDMFDASSATSGTLMKGKNGNDQLSGGSADDKLYGDKGNDTLLGGAGSDQLDGGVGDDLLDGGAGDDRLTGGSGQDVFRFHGNFGTDKIMDFGSGDRIDLGGFADLARFSDLSIAYANGTAIIEIGDAKIIVCDIDRGGLGASDFLF